jgi:hypothetical protein
MPKGSRGEKRPADVIGNAVHMKLHKAHKMTPAMAAGVSDRLWSVGDIVDLIETNEGVGRWLLGSRVRGSGKCKQWPRLLAGSS